MAIPGNLKDQKMSRDIFMYIVFYLKQALIIFSLLFPFLLYLRAGNMRGFGMGGQQFRQFFTAGNRSSLLGPVPMGMAIKSPIMGFPAARPFHPHPRYFNNNNNTTTSSASSAFSSLSSAVLITALLQLLCTKKLCTSSFSATMDHYFLVFM